MKRYEATLYNKLLNLHVAESAQKNYQTIVQMTGHDSFTIKSLEYQASYFPVRNLKKQQRKNIRPKLFTIIHLCFFLNFPNNKHLQFMILIPTLQQAQLALMEQNFQLHSQLRKAPESMMGRSSGLGLYPHHVFFERCRFFSIKKWKI